MDTYTKLLQSARGLNAKYPKGVEPFQIVSRICEEAGEVAKEISHHEDSGIKREKYGEPSKENLAGEVKNLLWATMQVIEYYGIHAEVEASIDKSWEKLKSQGFIVDDQA